VIPREGVERPATGDRGPAECPRQVIPREGVESFGASTLLDVSILVIPREGVESSVDEPLPSKISGTK